VEIRSPSSSLHNDAVNRTAGHFEYAGIITEGMRQSIGLVPVQCVSIARNYNTVAAVLSHGDVKCCPIKSLESHARTAPHRQPLFPLSDDAKFHAFGDGRGISQHPMEFLSELIQQDHTYSPSPTVDAASSAI